MFGSATVDTAIGLSFIFALSALLCTGLVELGTTLMRKKGKYLLRGLNDLLGAAGSTATGWRKGIAKVTAGASLERPMYGAALNAGSAATPAPAGPTLSLMDVMAHPLVDVLKSTSASGEKVRNPAEDLPTFQAGLERWYDEQMDRIGAAYTRWAHRWCVVIALALAGILGIDAIAIGAKLYTDPVVRQTVVATATAGGASALCAKSQTVEDRQACVDAELAKLGGAGMPLGWGVANRPTDPIGWLGRLVGIVLTALAIRMGAPFWFNTIGRLQAVRKTPGDRPVEAAL